MYQCSFQSFINFRKEFGLRNIWPVPVSDLVYIAHMFKSNASPSTITSYMSGISFFHKINDLEDNTQKFVIRKLLEGFKRSKCVLKDTRMPITRPLLVKILLTLPTICKSSYEASLFAAAFTLAFHGFMRVGELTWDKNNPSHTIQVHNIIVCVNYVEVYIASSKTDQLGRGTTLCIPSQENQVVCPVVCFKKYLKNRPEFQGALFCHFDGSPLTRYQFSAHLKRSLSCLGIDVKGFKSHSFRIGAATSYAMEGMSDERIQVIGRWASQAYLNYIRL